MSNKARVTAALLLAAIAIGTVAVYAFVRVRHWHEAGANGVSYLPAYTKPRKVPPPGAEAMLRHLQPVSVLFVQPGSPAHVAGIAPGDSVVSINGIRTTDVDALASLDRKLKAGDVVRYRLRRGDREREVGVRLESPLRNPVAVTGYAVSIFVAIVFVVTGIFVFTKSPDDRRTRVFFAMAVFGALSMIVSIAAALDGANARGIATQQTSATTIVVALGAFSIALLPLTLHLALVFPKDRPVVQRWPAVIRWVYAIPGVVLSTIGFFVVASLLASEKDVFGAGLQVGKWIRSFEWVFAIAGVATAAHLLWQARRERFARAAFINRPVQVLVTAMGLVFIFASATSWIDPRIALFAGFAVGGGLPILALVTYPVLSCISLYRSYSEAGPEEKRQVKWPLWGTIIALSTRILFAVASVLVVVLVATGQMPAGPTALAMQALDVVPKFAYILIPISFAFAILKHRLMDIDVIIKKTVAYGILSGIIIVLYVGIVGGVGGLLVGIAGVRNQNLVIGATVLVALFFVPLRNKLQTLVDRNLFRQKYDYPQALQTLSEEIVSATDELKYLASATEILQVALQNHSVAVFIERDRELIAVAKIGLPDAMIGSRIDLAQLAPSTFERPLDPRRRELPQQAATVMRSVNAALVLPVRVAGALRGLVTLGPKLTRAEYDVEDLDFLASASDQIGVAIDRIRLAREGGDVTEAAEIQRALLPAVMPDIAGFQISGVWKPARTVGGDYYDVIELGSGRYAICIGDVAGKGVPAALLMSSLQAAVRASAPDAPGAAYVCERVRRVIVSNLTGGRFVTFFYAVLDAAAGTLTYCNAGHNPPIVVRADGSTSRLETGGPAIVRIFREAFEEATVTLGAGDRVLLYTDGVTECRSRGGDEFGDVRVEEVVRGSAPDAKRIREAVVDAVMAFCGGELEDDLTLVALTRPA